MTYREGGINGKAARADQDRDTDGADETKHLHRYINEFAGRHNVRDLDTIEQLTAIAAGMTGKVLPYQDLIAEPEARR